MKSNKLLAEVKMVQHAVLEQYSKYKATRDSDYIKIGSPMTKEEVEQVIVDMQITLLDIPSTYLTMYNDNKVYYKLNKESLLEIGITNTDDEYIVNYISGEVINLTKKITNDGKNLYVRGNSFYNTI